MPSKRTPAANIALGGVLAALAVVIMSMGTLIPIATYTCPMICAILAQIILNICGSRIAWAWYGAVALLGLLLAPDKEAAAVFVFLGNYPMLKPKLDMRKGKWFWKLLYFNASVLLLYWLLMNLLGMEQVTAEFSEMGTVMTIVLLVLGNVTFLLLDRVLSTRFKQR